MHRKVSSALALLLIAAAARAADSPNLADHYRPVADRLIDAALADREGYQRLTYLCYRIGNRLSGSPSLAKAIAWSVEQMNAVGLEQRPGHPGEGAALGARCGIGAHARAAG